MGFNQHLTEGERKTVARAWIDRFVEKNRELFNVNDVGIAYASTQGGGSSATAGWDRVAYDFAKAK